MNTSISLKYVVGGIAAAAIFAGCSAGGAQSGFAPPASAQSPAASTSGSPSVANILTPALPGKAAPSVQPDHQRSWMSPEGKKQALLYVSDQKTDDVYVYSYPAGTLVGTLTGFDVPYGQCTDKSGDVFIAQFDASDVTEYAHGGTNPIKTLDVPAGQYPTGCSVDPKTGNLVVATFVSGSNPGGISVFRHATGTPKEYQAPNMYYYFPPAYDNRGNLFVEVEADSSGGTSVYELPHNGSKLRALYLNLTIHFPGGVQWDGTNLDVDDQLFSASGGSGIYQVQVQGSIGTMTGEFALPGSCGYSDVVQPWVQGSKIIGADTYCGTVGIDTYPGGANQKYLSGTQYPIGATVSKAKI
ncbi:MAG: hypothetical protein ABSD52_12770 [Candidatus Cybelea sp.]|jgi:hypothetical protein